jgi:8-oxo-dGTP pyrophosphatase MutT (NUDIX family)
MCAIRETYEEIGLDISVSNAPLVESYDGFICNFMNHFRFGYPYNTCDTFVLNLSASAVGEKDIPSNEIAHNNVNKYNVCGIVEKYEGNFGYIKTENFGVLSFDRRNFKQYISRGSKVSFQIVETVVGEYTVEDLHKIKSW